MRADDATAWLCSNQIERLRELVEIATDEFPSRSTLLAGQADIAAALHDGAVLDALRVEAMQLLADGEVSAALAWGRVAYVAHRRFAHGWLGFLHIALAAGVLRQVGLEGARCSPAANQTIPRALLQYWDKANVPADVRTLVDQWRSQTAGFQHHLVHDDEARRFLAENFDASVLHAYDIAPHVASKSDLFRLAWLARHGGIYIDADECRQDDVNLLLPPDAGLVLNWSNDETPCINNWFIATRPDHPLIWSQLRLGVSRVMRARAEGLNLGAWVVSGPSVTSMCLLDAACARNPAAMGLSDVRIHTEAVFREVVSNGWFLKYKEDPALNWRLAPG